MTDEPTKAAKVRMPSIRLIVWVVGIATALTGDRLAGALLVLGFETGCTATTPLKDTRNDR